MKIAIVGSAPSSAALAPYDDPEWTIWGCSPGAVQHVKRVDEWFELHRWGQPWLTQGYTEFLAGLGKPVHMLECIEAVPTSVVFDHAPLVDRFGKAWFTSTPAWMMAAAILRYPAEIGLWGIDMAADDEYALQKPGLLYFIQRAREQGIRITVPMESDLLQTPPLYGVGENSPMMVKLLIRQDELARRIANANATIEGATREKIYLEGAVDNLRYVMQTWMQ